MNLLNAAIGDGVCVLEPAVRSVDLVCFFNDEADDGSTDLRSRNWVEVDLPISLFNCSFTMDELGPLMRDPWRLQREHERNANILAWVQANGGWQEALKVSPVLAILKPEGLHLVDGWHRTKLARQAGQTTVHALIGLKNHAGLSSV